MEKKIYSSPNLEIVKLEMEESTMIPISMPAYPYCPISAYE